MEGYIAVVRIVANRLVERLVKTEKQCWDNVQFSRRDTVEIVCIPDSVDNSVLDETLRGVFKQIVVEIDKRNVEACYRLKKKGKNYSLSC